MGDIFVSYRREDSQAITDRIFDHLTRYFSRRSLFKDVDNIPAGVDFRTHIDSAVRRSAVMLTIIGPGWLSARDAMGHRRLDDPADFVRSEIASAIRLERPIIPVLVGGAGMPRAEELPETLKSLAYINAVLVRADPDFLGDFSRLRRAIIRLTRRRYGGSAIWIVTAAATAVFIAGIIWYVAVKTPDRPVTPPSEVILPEPPPPSLRPCHDIPFTDTTKFPPVSTTRRVCD